MSLESRDWMVKAKCRGTTEYEQYDSDNRGKGQTASANSACDGCPVPVECARYALSLGAQARVGLVWAGVPVPEMPNTKYEREATRKLQIIASYPTRDEL